VPHKVVDKAALQKLQEYREYCALSIDRVKKISRAKKEEGVVFALDIIRDMKVNSELRKNQALRKANSMNLIKAHGFEKEESAYQRMIDLFENPTAQISFYKTEMDRVDDEMSKRKGLEQR
jgi:hypothetical protein